MPSSQCCCPETTHSLPDFSVFEPQVRAQGGGAWTVPVNLPVSISSRALPHCDCPKAGKHGDNSAYLSHCARTGLPHPASLSIHLHIPYPASHMAASGIHLHILLSLQW